MLTKQNSFILFILLLCIGKVHSQDTHSEFRIEFRAGSAVVEPEFANNAHHFEEIKAFTERVNKSATAEILRVKFGGSTSLEGSEEYNDSLTMARRNAIKEYFRKHLNIPTQIIYYNDSHINWPVLRSNVERADFRYRDDVLRIIDEQPIIVTYYDNLTIDRRILKLRKLDGGRVWKYLFSNFFQDMRYAKAEFVVTGLYDDVQEKQEGESNETETQGFTSDSNEPDDNETGDIPTEDTEDIVEQCKNQRLAIKTNFIYDAILLPSLELEYKINRHWSVSIEGDVAWWKNDAKHKYYQLALISPEVRYKLNGERPWRGSYIGLFGGYSWYDLENGGRGYKGEAEMIGLSYNYMWSIGKHLSLEAGIGAGVMFTQYEEYLPIDGHYVYQQTSRLFYAGPLKLKLALVWRLWNQNCK